MSQCCRQRVKKLNSRTFGHKLLTHVNRVEANMDSNNEALIVMLNGIKIPKNYICSEKRHVKATVV